MKIVKAILSLIMIASLLLSTVICAAADSADAETGADNCKILGDIDADGDITIIDGTWLQYHLSEMKTLNDAAINRSDTDLDGDATIVDVTHLQHYLAQHEGVYYLGLSTEDAMAAKLIDEENARLAEEARLAKEAAAAEAAQAISDRAERTRQAKAEYKAKLKEYNSKYSLQAQIEQSIKNYKKQKGVDISEFNGDVDFEKLKAAGYTFVMIRMGFGGNLTSQDDLKFEENVKKAEAACMPWGAYLYSYALNTTSAESEVKHTLRLLKGKKPTMPIAFDLEYDSYKTRNGVPSNKMLHDISVTYLKGIANAGYYPILYSGYYWLIDALNAKDLTGTYDIWLAEWSTKMDYNTDKVGMWQYGGEVNYLESQYIPGLNGIFDKDFCFKNYPVIIPAYGYNNHTALIEGGPASTSAQPDDLYFTDEELLIEDGERIPSEYNGVMGNSFK